MKLEETLLLEPGIYIIDWIDGSYSLAAIGIDKEGKRWLAPTDWIEPNIYLHCRWHEITDATLLLSNDGRYSLPTIPLKGLRKV